MYETFALFNWEAYKKFLGALGTFQDNPIAPLIGVLPADCYNHRFFTHGFITQAASFTGWTFYIVIFRIIWFVNGFNQ